LTFQAKCVAEKGDEKGEERAGKVMGDVSEA
jgi:hypothetical protein